MFAEKCKQSPAMIAVIVIWGIRASLALIPITLTPIRP
jgi:hypothetical protein